MKYMASTRPDRQEHDGEQPALGLGLPGHAGDRLAPGQAVADGGADGAAAQDQAAADHGAGQLDRWSSWVLPSDVLLCVWCRDW